MAEKNKKAQPRRQQEEDGEGSVLNAAVQDGMNSLVQNHPQLKHMGSYLQRHLDQTKLQKYIQQTTIEVSGDKGRKKLSDQEKIKLMYKNIANFVASGEALDEEGQEVILDRSLVRKTHEGWRRSESRQRLKGEQYLERTVDAFTDLYDMVSQGDYAKRMPEIAEAVYEVNQAGWLNAAAKVMRHKGILTEEKYRELQEILVDRVKQGEHRARSGLEKYATMKKAAAILVGISGAAMISISGTGMTGNVIGASSSMNIAAAASGLAMILVSFFMLFRSR